MRVVVVGAGHNGLVAACYLARAGAQVTVVERDTVVGGAVSTVERWPGYALIEAELKTGRTHQIRVHLAHLGLPIVGDAKYGDFALNKALARANARPSFKRMFLHAWRLALRHPVSGEMLQLEAALPPELAPWVNFGRKRYWKLSAVTRKRFIWFLPTRRARAASRRCSPSCRWKSVRGCIAAAWRRFFPMPARARSAPRVIRSW